MSWDEQVALATVAALQPLADADRATPMSDYMKGVAPFLGIQTAPRRRAQRAAWAQLDRPTREELLAAAAALAALPQREYHYAAIELLGRHRVLLQPDDLDGPVRDLLVQRPWWDTVDLMGSRVITPMVAGDQRLVAVMRRWNATGDQWLIRAAVQHQRGLGADTDIDRLLDLCAPHAGDRRFFVAKAVGWALRDLARLDPDQVRRFLATHPELAPVARREALRGLGPVTGAD